MIKIQIQDENGNVTTTKSYDVAAMVQEMIEQDISDEDLKDGKVELTDIINKHSS